MLLTLAAVLVMAPATAAHACRPLAYANAQAQFAASDVVFTGRVVSVERRRLGPGRVLTITRFRVLNSIKGRVELEREVFQVFGEQVICGGAFRSFARGRTYLVLASIRDKGLLYTSGLQAPQFPQADFEALKQTR